MDLFEGGNKINVIHQQLVPTKPPNSSTKTSNSEIEPEVEMTFELWIEQLASFRLIPAFISIIAVGVIIQFLRKMRKVDIHTHFQVYCVLLAFSDLIVSICGFLTITGSLKFFRFRPVSIAESTTLMFVGLNSLNTHVLIAVDRARSTLTTIRQHTNRQRSLINMPYLITSIIVSISMSFGWTIAPFIIGHPKYQMEFNGYFWGMDYGDKTRAGRTYIILLLVFEYCIPLATIAGIYAEILRRMVKQSQRAASALKTRRITIICGLSTAAFIAGWTPYAILTLVSFFDITPGLNFVFFANAAAKLSCVYNCSMFWASTRMGRQRDVTNSARGALRIQMPLIIILPMSIAAKSNNRSKKDDNSSSASNPASRFKSSAKSGGPSSARLKLSDRTNTTDGSKTAIVNAISARDVNSDPGCPLSNKDPSEHDGERSNREKFKKARRSLKSFKKKSSKKEAIVVANFASNELTEKQVTEKQTQTSTLKLELHPPPTSDANAHSSSV